MNRFSWLFWIVYCGCVLPFAPAHSQDTPQTRMRPIDAWHPIAERVDWSSVRHVSLQRLEDGRLWRFDQPQPAHDAAVRVSIGRFAGSGTIIGTTGQACVVLTNHHVVSDRGNISMTLQCTMRDGSKFSGKYIGVHVPLDLAAYLVERNNLPSIAVSSQNVPLGEIVTVMAFGGPENHNARFRPFIAPSIQPQAQRARVAVDAGTISGDSGSGMVWRGGLVGVNFGSIGGYSAREGQIDVHWPSSSFADAESINLFLTQCLGPYGCAPRVSPPGQGIGGSGSGSPYYPPATPQQPPQLTPPQQPVAPPQITPPQQPAEPPATCPPCEKLDDEAIKKIIADAVAAASKPGPKGDRGEPGLAGPAGPQGPQGPAGADGRDSELDIEAIAAAVIAKIPPRRFILVDGNTRRIIDDENYQTGEPIILDIQQIIRPK
jgi:hypothetical protein